jgi:hypothetical protein
MVGKRMIAFAAGFAMNLCREVPFTKSRQANAESPV